MATVFWVLTVVLALAGIGLITVSFVNERKQSRARTSSLDSGSINVPEMFEDIKRSSFKFASLLTWGIVFLIWAVLTGLIAHLS